MSNDQGIQNQDGDYIIATPSDILTVFCDTTTDSGGYTHYPVIGGLQTEKYSDNDSCKELELNIVVPRTKAYFKAMIDIYTSSYFKVIPRIYKPTSGGVFSSMAMDSDYAAGCWLGGTPNPLLIDNIIFNDSVTGGGAGCNTGYNTTPYICSTNDFNK